MVPAAPGINLLILPFTYFPAPAPETEPALPRISLFEPVVILPLVKVREPLTVISLLRAIPALLFIVRLLNVVAPPRLCSELPFKVTVPLPSVKVPLLLQFPATDKLAGATRVPSEIVRLPMAEVPLSVRVLAPLLVKPPEPLIAPAMLTALPLVLIVPFPVIVISLSAAEVIAPVACNVPPLKISVFVALPSPRALLELALNVPPAMVVVPV